MKKIVLASQSPRRKALLKQIGLKFEVDVSNYSEEMKSDLKPHALAKHLSLQKAKEVAKRHKNAIIIAADTFILFQNKFLGKPKSKNEAVSMLKRLNGKSHLVITGFTIIDTESNKSISQYIETKVFLRKLNLKEIKGYVNHENLMDKAGSYAIQEGLGPTIVEKIEGDYFNVVGLPICKMVASLNKFGVSIL